MRIGITCYPTYGGSGIVATELGLELANRGHDVHFITYANPIRLDPGIPRIYYHEVEVSNYPLFQYPPYCLSLASRMTEVAERYGLDLLHVHYAIPHSISALLARQMNRRAITDALALSSPRFDKTETSVTVSGPNVQKNRNTGYPPGYSPEIQRRAR